MTNKEILQNIVQHAGSCHKAIDIVGGCHKCFLRQECLRLITQEARFTICLRKLWNLEAEEQLLGGQ